MFYTFTTGLDTVGVTEETSGGLKVVVGEKRQRHAYLLHQFRKKCEKKMTSRQGKSTGSSTKSRCWYRVHREETVAPPGCGTQEPQTGAGHISNNAFVLSALCATTVLQTLKTKAGSEMCFLGNAGRLIHSLLLQMAVIALSLSLSSLPRSVQCSF